MAGTVLAEVRETEAPKEIAAIYAEIRAATGLPFVNLLWRHMAAVPGILPWVWSLVGQAYQSGAVTQQAHALRRRSTDLALPALPPPELAAAGLDDVARASLRDLIEAYNRGNAQNLIGWSALSRHLAGDAAGLRSGSDANVQAFTPLRALSSLPPLPRADALPHQTFDLVERLTARHGGFPAGTYPSLYLHLAAWPSVLPLIDRRLAAVLTPQRLDDAVSGIGVIVDGAAERLAQYIRTPNIRTPIAAPAPEVQAQFRRTLHSFVSRNVREMLVVGMALGCALDRN